MKAIALLSGGLDSTLAIKVVLKQGVQVEALNFFSPFCQCNRQESGCGYTAKKVAANLGVPLKVINISMEFLELLKGPRHGFGRNLNPCIDCRILMLKKTKDYMKTVQASFVITGEVLGQRPMSQHRAALEIVERESGLEGLVLRPLSAKLLSPTTAEKQGWVDRQRLLEISGRSRKPQMNLARTFEIKDFSCPAGGCLLTDSGFSRRMKDLMLYAGITLNDVELLKLGRHFRLSKQAKLIVGRNKEENQKLGDLRQAGDLYFYPVNTKGPDAIGRGEFSQQEIIEVCRIVARYCDRQAETKTAIASCLWPDTQPKVFEVQPAEELQLNSYRI